MNLRLPYFWAGMGHVAKAGYLVASAQARSYEEACRILRGLRKPTPRKYPQADAVADMERRRLW